MAETDITSDCEAVSDITQTHKWCPTGPPSADCTLAAVTTSGMDTSCDAYLPPNLPKAVADGAVKMSDVLGMLSNLFATRMRLGHFDPPSSQPYMQIGLNRLCANQSLSHESARQSVVLLKNRNRVLPLKASAISSIAVVGPNADNAPVQQGNYFGDPCFSNAWNEPLLYSIRAGMEPFVPTVAYAQGCDVGCTNTTGFAAAAAAAGAADATVVVVGLDQDIESEGTDRVSIALPGSQAALITQVCAASKGPCVVVVMSGGPVDVSAAAGDDNVAAIMYVGCKCAPAQATPRNQQSSAFTPNPKTIPKQPTQLAHRPGAVWWQRHGRDTVWGGGARRKGDYNCVSRELHAAGVVL